MSRRELGLLALIGFGVWLSGALTFRFLGVLFESGPLVLALSALGVAASVCFLFKAVTDWRKVPVDQLPLAGVAMVLPGLFADALYVANFNLATGLQPATAGPFAAVILFGNAALLAYALMRARRPA